MKLGEGEEGEKVDPGRGVKRGVEGKDERGLLRGRGKERIREKRKERGRGIERIWYRLK